MRKEIVKNIFILFFVWKCNKLFCKFVSTTAEYGETGKK